MRFFLVVVMMLEIVMNFKSNRKKRKMYCLSLLSANLCNYCFLILSFDLIRKLLTMFMVHVKSIMDKMTFNA